MTIPPAPPAGARHAPRRPAPWLLAVALAWLLAVQLFAAAQHDHETASPAQHCASCMVHAQAHAPPPGAAPIAAYSGARPLHRVLTAPAPPARAGAADHLLPPPHGPPALPIAC